MAVGEKRLFRQNVYGREEKIERMLEQTVDGLLKNCKKTINGGSF